MSQESVEQEATATRDYLDYLTKRVEVARELSGNEKRTYLRRHYLPGVFVLSAACIRGRSKGRTPSLELEQQTALRMNLDDPVLRAAKSDMFEKIKLDLVNKNERWEQVLNLGATAAVYKAVADDEKSPIYERRLPGLGSQLEFMSKVVLLDTELTREAGGALFATIGREVKS